MLVGTPRPVLTPNADLKTQCASIAPVQTPSSAHRPTRPMADRRCGVRDTTQAHARDSPASGRFRHSTIAPAEPPISPD
ncbi:hypothetical protein BURMUCF2_3045 [Burkholderia multivorans CF2]|nr:hypothetical protein BURMUCF2_3045 [Burkholderia multivorans CF2]